MRDVVSSPQTVGLLCCVTLACAAAASVDGPSAPAQYQFAYAVNDPTTGDQKDQQETRNGDDVAGYYRTVDPDGYLRTVRYRSDAVNGFTAQVVREPVPGAVAAPAQKAVVPAPSAPAPVVVRVPYAEASAPVPVVVPYATNPASYYYSPPTSYAYGYRSYSPYAAHPYGSQYPYVGYYPYSSQYPYNSQYPFGGRFALRK